jgi:hypothetical protein
MVHEGQVAHGQRAHGFALHAAGLLERDHEHESPRVVVQTVALGVARDDVRSVLQEARVVGQAAQVLEVQFRQPDGTLGQGACAEGTSSALGVRAHRVLQAGNVTPGHRSPGHPSSELARTSAHLVGTPLVRQQSDDLPRDRVGVPPFSGHGVRKQRQ